MPTLEAAPFHLDRILLATDFSPVSELALHYSLTIARRNRSRMYLAHVVRPEAYQVLAPEARQRALDEAWREAHRHMTDLLIAGHLDGIEHQVIVEQGEIWEVIAKLVQDLTVNLIVVGTHGRSRLGKLLLGSVAESIFRQSPCPVLMVGPKANAEVPEAGPQRILFSTGFSGHSLRAGSAALSLAQRQGAELILLHVIAEEVDPTVRPARQRAAVDRMKELIPAGVHLEKPPQFVVEFGTAAERIQAVAAERSADLIVLGVRQPVGFARRLKWATAYEVVSNAPCPVLTVKTQVEE